MKEKTYSQVLREIACDGIPADLNLTPKIIAQVQKGKSVTMQPRIKAFVIAVVILLVAATLLINAPVVAAAIQRWFGYVPGLGLVRDGQIRELAGPASVTQNGFTLKVDKVALSSEKTVFTYSLETITPDMQVPDGVADSPGCSEGTISLPYMRLPDGRKLEMLEPYGITGSPYNTEMTLAPMPADVNEATLVFDCVFRTLPEKVPQHWELPLRFVAASPVSIAPVLEVPTTTANLSLTLKNVIPNKDGYIIAGTITVIPPQGYIVRNSLGCLVDGIQEATITDANGQVLEFDQAPNDFMMDYVVNQAGFSALPANTYGWALYIHSGNIQWPLTMKVHSLRISGPLLPQAEFQFDTGPDPKYGQVWELNQDVHLGSKTVHVISVKLEDLGNEEVLYTFNFSNNPDLDFSPTVQGYEDGGGTSNAMAGEAIFYQGLSYSKPGPKGLLTVLLSGHELSQLPGSWQATWQAPGNAGNTATP